MCAEENVFVAYAHVVADEIGRAHKYENSCAEYRDARNNQMAENNILLLVALAAEMKFFAAII